MGAHKIFAETIDPVGSVGLMEKLGMTREGVLRRHTTDCNGEFTDVYVYGLLRDTL
jgi:RimJ/RimL family protein N-acetyltransferase